MHFTDQIGHSIHLPQPPQRIVSLVPSQTELLFHLGLGAKVVGLTKFCIHPQPDCKAKQRVGGTKQVSLEKIAALRPDLIIANKEENDRQTVEALQQQYPVWTSDIETLEDALAMIASIGQLTQKEPEAGQLNDAIRTAFESLKIEGQETRAAYMIWYKPWMAVGSGTFIHELLRLAGFINVLEHKTRYPILTLEELAAAKPAVVLLSSEPFPFKQRHIDEVKKFCPMADVRLVDGEMFSWYGSRLLLAAPYFVNLRNEISCSLNH
ncbi:MAG: ABC transporter substrate-binding protein [Saprospiraceae bacterium]|nr:ABC transporter substrate-binding protein [Saprospiraceae bacterium]